MSRSRCGPPFGDCGIGCEDSAKVPSRAHWLHSRRIEVLEVERPKRQNAVTVVIARRLDGRVHVQDFHRNRVLSTVREHA